MIPDFLKQLGWPEQAEHEKGMLIWRSTAGRTMLEATLARSGRAVETIVAIVKAGANSTRTPAHSSKWSVDGSLVEFKQYGNEQPLQAENAIKAFQEQVALIGNAPAYLCMGPMAAVATAPKPHSP